MLLLGEIYISFHWLHICWWKSVQPLKYKVSNEHIMFAYLFNKRQRIKDQMTAMRKDRPNFVCWLRDNEFIPEGFIRKLLLAGETFNSLLMDETSKQFSLFLGFLWIQID